MNDSAQTISAGLPHSTAPIENHQSEVAVTFEPGQTTDVPVILDDAAKRKLARQARLANAAAYEKLGQRLLKFKAKKYGEVGDYIVATLGVKKVGHGTILSASENAEEYIYKCDALAQELLARTPPVDPEVILGVMQLARDFNKQLGDFGEAHLRVDRQPTVSPEDKTFSVPFPSGTPMMIAINQPPPQPKPLSLPPVEPPVPEA